MDSAIGSSGQAATSIQYTTAKSASTSGRRTLRRSQMTTPGGDTVDYYYSTDSSVSGSLSRVGSVKLNSTTIASYYYMGTGTVVRTDLSEPLLKSEAEDAATVGSYPDLDRFNRITRSRWTKVLLSPKDFYDVEIGYDQVSNIMWTVDNIHLSDIVGLGKHIFDVDYDLDDMHRVVKADEGEVTGGVYSGSRRVVEEWGLSQTGNFATNQCSLDGNTSYTDTGDINDARTHDAANQITQWRPDGTNNLTPGYDAVGNLTDDGRDYTFKYDALGRLISATNKSSKVMTAYRYNGLGYRIGWHYDVDKDGDLEATTDDPWVYNTYDERWRVVATYIAGQTTPKEQFYYHAAGLGGYGSSSYIDLVILRDRDMANEGEPIEFTTEGDGTLEERVYYCQNWRADVSALVDYTTGETLQLEHDKYLSYGTPWGLPAGDLDSDGDYDTTDESNITSLISVSEYDVRADANLDGTLDSTDTSLLSGSKFTLGRGFMSRGVTGNRKGYAGYENDGILGDGAIDKSCNRFWHVRHRVLDSTLGRWTKRDPAGYVDGASLFAYLRSSPIARTDLSGLCVDGGGAKCLANSEGSQPISQPIGKNTFVANPDCDEATWPINNPPCNDRTGMSCEAKCDCDRDQTMKESLCTHQNDLNRCSRNILAAAAGTVAACTAGGTIIPGLGNIGGFCVGIVIGVGGGLYAEYACVSDANQDHDIRMAKARAEHARCVRECGGSTTPSSQ